ncbi:hypothetical protein LCGC14_1670030 [marine sediment metagenome]|uniref:Uncharacterized protein n=1 Tax=marine sediment metagenome TaxID=412755 RepID=A0A0F9HRL0_9ZZZZ
MNKNANKNINNNKFSKNKLVLEEVSKGKKYLLMLLNTNNAELKKITIYADGIRSSIKTLKELIREVK